MERFGARSIMPVFGRWRDIQIRAVERQLKRLEALPQ
jgi:hypothetical protein